MNAVYSYRVTAWLGAILVLRNAVGVGVSALPGKKRYEGVRLLVLQGGGWWSNSLEKSII